MALYQLQLPKMGESVSEATITKWLKQPGDTINEDDAILEIATDKVDSDVPSPIGGILVEQLFAVDTVVQVGTVIATIEIADASDSFRATAAADSSNHTPSPALEVEIPGTALEVEIPGTAQLEVAQQEPKVTYGSTVRFYSPLVRNIAQQEGLSQSELEGIPGSGAEGRVTKEDILAYINIRPTSLGDTSANTRKDHTKTAEQNNSNTIRPEQEAQQRSNPVPVVNTGQAKQAQTIGSAGDDIIEMDRMRRLIADHMLKSVQTFPHVCSFVEADVTNLVTWRNKIKDAYKKREGENITFTPLFIEAVSKALKDFPMVNISVDGHTIIKKKNINIGMAAALPSGNLIVPVIKNADQLSLVGLTKSVNDLAQRSRANKLKPDDTQDGTFTFTNIGAFGNIMGTPIINQPQAAILAVGTITKKPAVIETETGDMIGIRHMMYLSMSYDHRVIDGALGGTFLKRVADYLEHWDVNREI